MNIDTISDSIKWVSEVTTQEIDVEKAQAGISFLLFWSLVEGNFMRGKEKKSLDVERLFELGEMVVPFMENDAIDKAYSFFSGVYFPNTREDARFEKLRLATSAKRFLENQSDEIFVRQVLTEPQSSKIDKLYSVLFITHRYRNNLFHGIKSPTVLDKFSREFSVINAFLKAVIQPVLSRNIKSVLPG
jgi:hypothetical protein